MNFGIIYLLKQILASAYRIEHKQDLLLRAQSVTPKPMESSPDSITGKPVVYNLVVLPDESQVAVRTDSNVPQIKGHVGILRENGKVETYE